MPPTRAHPKRKPDDIDLPVPGQDAAERKRVLNVLAQRRYRERKKEHIKKLEAREALVQPIDHASRRTQQSSTSPQDSPSDNASASSRSSRAQAGSSQFESFLNELPTIVGEGDAFDDTSFDPTMCFSSTSPVQAQKIPMAQAAAEHAGPFQIDPFAVYDDATNLSFPTDGQSFWDPSLPLPSISNSPVSSTTGSSSNGSMSWTLPSFPLVDEEESNTVIPAMGNELSVRPQTHDQQYCFPDEAHLEMLELTLLRGCMMVATRLNIQELIWSLTAVSPFTDPSLSFTHYKHLPSNLQPTIVQLTVPHHPLLDLLPWPKVRDRLILILSQPPESRPPQAASPTALMDFVYDVEDSSEGIRLSGNDPYSANNWEVGEKVFNSWWWIFDRDVLKRSNELRESRGALLLGNNTGSVLDEVV